MKRENRGDISDRDLRNQRLKYEKMNRLSVEEMKTVDANLTILLTLLTWKKINHQQECRKPQAINSQKKRISGNSSRCSVETNII